MQPHYARRHNSANPGIRQLLSSESDVGEVNRQTENDAARDVLNKSANFWLDTPGAKLSNISNTTAPKVLICADVMPRPREHPCLTPQP
jgi:hypothetical protein